METNFLADTSIPKNSVVITNQLPIVHYYSQKEVLPYPDSWNLDMLKNSIDSTNVDRSVYIFFANYDMTDAKIKKDLDDNFKKVFECSQGWGNAAIYKYE